MEYLNLKEDEEDPPDLKPFGERKHYKKEDFSQKEKNKSERSEEFSQIDVTFPSSSKEEIFGVGEAFSVVIDCELKNNFLKMDLAKELAKWLCGKYLLLEDLKAENLVSLIGQIKTEDLNFV